MGNVLRALKKSAQRNNEAERSAVHVVSMAVADAEKAAQETLDDETIVGVPTADPTVDAAAPPTVEPAPAPEVAPTAVVEAPAPAPAPTPAPAPAAAPAPAPAAPVKPVASAPIAPTPEAAESRITPMRRSSFFSPLIMTHHRPRCQVSEQIRQIRTGLIRLANGGPVRCMITSSQPREGKTVTAVNLAYTFSEIAEKRTLLIDADLRRGSVAGLLGMTRRSGLAELLDGTCTSEQAIWSAGRSNFHVLTAGTAKLDRIGELLSSEHADKVMEKLADAYEYIVIDSPPVISVADAGILGRWADTAVMAIRIHKTHRKLVEQATQILEGVGVPVAGIIALDTKAAGRSYYRYGGYAY